MQWNAESCRVPEEPKEKTNLPAMPHAQASFRSLGVNARRGVFPEPPEAQASFRSLGVNAYSV